MAVNGLLGYDVPVWLADWLLSQQAFGYGQPVQQPAPQPKIPTVYQGAKGVFDSLGADDPAPMTPSGPSYQTFKEAGWDVTPKTARMLGSTLGGLFAGVPGSAALSSLGMSLAGSPPAAVAGNLAGSLLGFVNPIAGLLGGYVGRSVGETYDFADKFGLEPEFGDYVSGLFGETPAEIAGRLMDVSGYGDFDSFTDPVDPFTGEMSFVDPSDWSGFDLADNFSSTSSSYNGVDATEGYASGNEGGGGVDNGGYGSMGDEDGTDDW